MARRREPDTAGAASRPPAPRARGRSAGVSSIVGGLLQDLEDRLRREVAPIEERVRLGAEARGSVAATASGPADPMVIVIPAAPAEAAPPDGRPTPNGAAPILA